MPFRSNNDPPPFRCPWSFGLAFIPHGVSLRTIINAVVLLFALGARFRGPVMQEINRRKKRKEDAAKLADRNFKDVVQFSLCSLDRSVSSRCSKCR